MEAILTEMEKVEEPFLNVEPEVVITLKEEKSPPLVSVLPTEIIVDDVENETVEDENTSFTSLPELEEISTELLELLGIDDDDEIKGLVKTIASSVGHEPRDTRVDRLLRLTLRAINPEVLKDQREQLLGELTEIAKALSVWTELRLSARNKGSGNGLLADSAELGKALSRIPGPGISVPLRRDNLDLPPTKDVAGLNNAVRNLANVSLLPVAGGIR